MATDSFTITFLQQFNDADHDQKIEDLQGILDAAPATVIEQAVQGTPQDKKDAAAKGAFGEVPPRDRKTLYLTLIIILAVLAAGGLIGGAIALVNKVDSAALFTFAGLALGGITGLYVPSPTGK